MKRKLLIFSLVFALLICQVSTVYADKNEDGTISVNAENVIEIDSTEDFLAFAEACKLDTYSIGKAVELKADISLSGTDFAGVPYFDGTFYGNGHTISGMYFDSIGSSLGLFRYVGVLGEVMDLNVKGHIVPTGSKTEIGGIAGVNYGVINNCTFTGNIYGEDAVGGIVGVNTLYGQILNCVSDAVVVATNNAGGIVGVNKGTVSKCLSKSRVNIEELEPVLEIEGMDMGDLNIAQTVITRNNSGGIAGTSSGHISECYNTGTVGYQHVGYNSGGIVGYQSGVIENCINYGEIYGRKDVGGIAGQAAPYIESDDYMSESIKDMEHSMNRIESTMNHLKNTMDDISNDMEATANDAKDMVSSNLSGLRQTGNTESTPGDSDANDSAGAGGGNTTEGSTENSTENGGGAGNEGSTENGGTSGGENGNDKVEYPELPDFSGIGNQINSIRDSVNNTIDNTIADMEQKANEMQQKVDSIESDMNSMTQQMEKLGTTMEEMTEITIEDVSSVTTADSMKGVITGCKNYGVIDGDLNVGGIAGIMSIESANDPEEDLDISTDIARTTRINDVVIYSINYGVINGKKNCAGGITGSQSLGLIHGCEGYGSISASAGDYVGGIVGQSTAAVEKSYSVSDLSGKNYIGGIAGEGATVKNCLSIAYIDSEGECLGAIAGNAAEDGSFKENYFIKNRYDGIDNISYSGEAEPTTFEKIMLMEGIPKGFEQVKVSFVLDGETIGEEYVPYGSTLKAEQFPKVNDTDEAYVKWPEEEKYTNILNNITLEAKYVPWVQSVAVETDEEKPVFIVVGKFYEGTKLQILPVEEKDFPVTIEGMKLLYSKEWAILSEQEYAVDCVEGHFYVPDAAEGEIQVYVKEGEGWIPVQTVIDGSYVVAEIPYQAAFAMVEIEPDNSGFYLTIAAAVIVLILVISIIIVHNKRKKKAKDDKK